MKELDTKAKKLLTQKEYRVYKILKKTASNKKIKEKLKIEPYITNEIKKSILKKLNIINVLQIQNNGRKNTYIKPISEKQKRIDFLKSEGYDINVALYYSNKISFNKFVNEKNLKYPSKN